MKPLIAPGLRWIKIPLAIRVGFYLIGRALRFLWANRVLTLVLIGVWLAYSFVFADGIKHWIDGQINLEPDGQSNLFKSMSLAAWSFWVLTVPYWLMKWSLAYLLIRRFVGTRLIGPLLMAAAFVLVFVSLLLINQVLSIPLGVLIFWIEVYWFSITASDPGTESNMANFFSANWYYIRSVLAYVSVCIDNFILLIAGPVLCCFAAGDRDDRLYVLQRLLAFMGKYIGLLIALALLLTFISWLINDQLWSLGIYIDRLFDTARATEIFIWIRSIFTCLLWLLTITLIADLYCIVILGRVSDVSRHQPYFDRLRTQQHDD